MTEKTIMLFKIMHKMSLFPLKEHQGTKSISIKFKSDNACVKTHKAFKIKGAYSLRYRTTTQKLEFNLQF